MAPKTSLALLLTLLFLSLSLAQRTSIFINKVPEYSALPSCAERPLSTIVRDMSMGCGDHSALTSYDCFCTSSSSHFSSLISKSVAQQCAATSPAAVTSALDVFNSYCELKEQTGATATPTILATTSSPVNGSLSVVARPSSPTRTSIAPIPSSTSGARGRQLGMNLVFLLGGVSIPGLLAGIL